MAPSSPFKFLNLPQAADDFVCAWGHAAPTIWESQASLVLAMNGRRRLRATSTFGLDFRTKSYEYWLSLAPNLSVPAAERLTAEMVVPALPLRRAGMREMSHETGPGIQTDQTQPKHGGFSFRAERRRVAL